ncbi:MAG TPA: adenylosuccinate lyase [Clostridia bacterium]|nr:adenylosuccinate lyase [Clostridia bacterium]
MIERYTLPEMSRIWSEENKYAKWLTVEILACEAWSHLGVVPLSALQNIKERAFVRPERVRELEAKMRHDVAAFVAAVAETVGEDGKYIHYGLTSYDVVDTSLSLLLREAVDLLIADLRSLMEAVKEKALRHKYTVQIGRTHGVHAEPVTFGLKMAVWYTELVRNLERLQRARDVVGVGRLSGAVGTYAMVDPYVEKYVCERLELKPASVSTQVLQRDRHAEYMAALAITACSIEKFAMEIRHLQRTEVREAEEPFGAWQKGSSAMPHKRNPVTCEQMCGLARVMRGNLQAALENVALWHERDISHSSVERIILPDSTILLDYMLRTFTGVVKGLRVYEERMSENIKLTHGLIFSQRVMLALVAKGFTREEAYAVVQSEAMKSWETGEDLRVLLAERPEVREVLSGDEMDALFDTTFYVRYVDEIFERAGLA